MSSGRHTVSVTSFTPEALARIAARHATKNKTVRGRYNRADAAIDLGNTCDDLRAAWGKDAQAPSRELKPAMHRNGTAIDIAKVDAALRRYGKH